MRWRAVVVTLLLVVSAAACGGDEPDTSDEAGMDRSPEVASAEQERPFIPGLTMVEARAPFLELQMKCREPTDNPARYSLPAYLHVYCIGGDSERKELAPFVDIVGQDEVLVDLVSIEVKNSDLSRLKRNEALLFVLALADLPFDGSDPERVRAWISSNFPVDGFAELEVGPVIFELSGHEYKQVVMVARPGSEFLF